MPLRAGEKRGAGHSQEVIEASFDLDSSSLDLDSYEEGSLKAAERTSAHNAGELSAASNLHTTSNEFHPVEEVEEERKYAVSQLATILEIAIHTILYVRQVYPAEIFVRRQKLGIPLFQCSKPELYSYISGLIESVAEEVLNGEVERLIVNVHDRDSIVETFTFLISHATEEPRSRLVGTSIMQGQMRSMLRKLNAIDSQLIPLNDLEHLTFSAMILTSHPSLLPSTTVSNNSEDADPTLVQIVNLGSLKLSLFVHESESKLYSLQTSSAEL